MKNRAILTGIIIFLFATYYLLFSFSTETELTKRGNDHLTIDKTNMRINVSQFVPKRLNDEGLIKKIVQVKESEYSPPSQWGENVNGVIRKLNTTEKVIALTFDACGGEFGSGYDEELINFLITEEIPATLFINSRWIDTNLDRFLYLSSLSQFQIENHGTKHQPLSVRGGTAWGIKGTTSVEEVVTEVVTNYEKIKELTGQEARYFRSGTAFYDDVAVQIVTDLGMKVVNYDILGDAGATFSATQVRDALLTSQPGSIALLHMNQPTKGTASGVKMAIPILKEQGFSFVTLDDGFKLE